MRCFTETKNKVCSLLGFYAAYNGSFVDVLGQTMSPIFKGQGGTAVQEKPWTV
jgi:hypothetical protein